MVTVAWQGRSSSIAFFDTGLVISRKVAGDMRAVSKYGMIMMGKHAINKVAFRNLMQSHAIEMRGC
jgi:hypothetical protein